MNKRTKTYLIVGIAALVLIAGAVLLLLFLPSSSEQEEATAKEFSSLTSTVDEAGVRTVSVPVDENGNPKENLSGALVEMLPANLTEIKVENANGNYVFKCSTDSDGATTYTLAGFEGYDLNDTNAAMLGSVLSNLDMAAVIDVTGESKSDYGFDEPRVTAWAKFDDESEFTVYVGDDGPGGTYTYVMIKGCDSVFSVSSGDLDPLLLDINDMFNTLIRSDYTTVSDEDFTYIKLGGTHLSKEVTIKHAEDGSLDGYYVLSSHDNKPVNSTLGSEIVGTIKSLTGESVAFANPDAATLKKLGLDNPYATVKARYEYTDSEDNTQTLDVSMLCSKPDSSGKVYLMDEGGKLVYTIGTDAIAWADFTFDELRSEYAFAPSYSAIKSMTLSVGDESYSFTVETVITESVDDDGEETSVSETSVKYGDKEIDEAYFRVLFEELSLIPVRGTALDSEKGSEELLTVTYEYTTGRAADTVVYLKTDSQKVMPEINGEVDCYIYKSDVDSVMSNAKALSEGKEIA